VSVKPGNLVELSSPRWHNGPCSVRSLPMNHPQAIRRYYAFSNRGVVVNSRTYNFWLAGVLVLSKVGMRPPEDQQCRPLAITMLWPELGQLESAS
jgi:hypothetical protein